MGLRENNKYRDITLVPTPPFFSQGKKRFRGGISVISSVIQIYFICQKEKYVYRFFRDKYSLPSPPSPPLPLGKSFRFNKGGGEGVFIRRLKK